MPNVTIKKPLDPETLSWTEGQNGVRYLDIHSLGAGVQSTFWYLVCRLVKLGDIKPLERIFEPEELEYVLSLPKTSCAIFADTGDEPDEVYRHLDWLASLGGIPIVIASAGTISDILFRQLTDNEAEEIVKIIQHNRDVQENNDFIKTITLTKQQPSLFQKQAKQSKNFRFTSIPVYSAYEEGKKIGKVRRQCTKEFKTDVINEVTRRHILSIKRNGRFPNNIRVRRYIGFSFDEPQRVIALKNQFASSYFETCHFPLFDMKLERADVKSLFRYFEIPHPVPRSACIFCPFKRNSEWRHLRDTDPYAWAKAIRYDQMLREPNRICNIAMSQKLYLHESCYPLDRAPIDEPDSVEKRVSGTFDTECEGACGF